MGIVTSVFVQGTMVAKNFVILLILSFASKSSYAQNVLFGVPPNIDEAFKNPDSLADSLFSEEQNSENEIFEEDFGVPDITSTTETSTRKNLKDSEHINDAQSFRERFSDSESAILEYENSLLDFTQQFIVEAWNHEGENFVISPFSLHTVIAMLTSGSTDNSSTQAELLDALGRHRSIQNLEQRYQHFVRDYKDTDVTEILNYGNKFWTTKKYFDKIRGQYLERISSFYDADFSVIKAKSPEKEINDWVKEQTKGKIEKIIDYLSPEVAFLIVNALYFKASWSVLFDEGVPQNFTTINGDRKPVPMMTRTSLQNYGARFETDIVPSVKFTTVAIPYAFQDHRFEMVIVMPEVSKGLLYFADSAKKGLNDPESENIFRAALDALEAERLNSKEYTINMPPFTVDSNIDVNKYLRAMGVNGAFDEGGFENIVLNEPLKVSAVKHRATVEVTRDGTVGAAASAIEIVSFSANLNLPKVINIDRPFLFFIRDTKLKAILFAGKYTNPDA